ncbi:piwi domain-containing protein [Colletotrichum orchidophilum]|uniref:Piwi domain-containing protein n=1 Tax=Colletotrichum orchidophilum TaxID=1209926 RepID=A0A1G4AXM4_9PEZI|nr:piwi domain-containing protein [Colletotrichum orchidophilum]OHE93881.1 piwi domain-containing protein [Colletotrichum orchidophilum]
MVVAVVPAATPEAEASTAEAVEVAPVGTAAASEETAVDTGTTLAEEADVIAVVVGEGPAAASLLAVTHSKARLTLSTGLINTVTWVARELPAPVVTYANESTLHTRSGSWNLTGVEFAKLGPRITNWDWVRIAEGANPRVSTDEVAQCVQEFFRFLNESGLVIDTQAPDALHRITVGRGIATKYNRRTFTAIADDTTKAKGSTEGFFLLVILPRKDTTLYGAVKSVADVHFGFHTVCSEEKSFLKTSPQTFANIGLKWNLKNGGNNHVVKDTYDVITSGKAMIAACDAVAREQLSRQEMLGDELTEHFKSRLMSWRQRNLNNLPEFIIIYRDAAQKASSPKSLRLSCL